MKKKILIYIQVFISDTFGKQIIMEAQRNLLLN